MKRIVFYSTLVIITTVVFSSCTKNKRNDILGTWRQMSFMVENDNSPEVLWTFNGDNTVIGEVYRNNELVNSTTAEYNVSFSKLQYRMDITRDTTIYTFHRFEVNGIDYRGEYVINELSRDKMAFVRVAGYNDNGEWSDGGDAFIQLEFVKQ